MFSSVRFCFPAVLLAFGTLASAQQAAAPAANAIVVPFGIAGASASTDPVMAKACPSGVAALPADQADDAQKVVTAIAQEMQTTLQQHLPTQLAQPGQTIAPGTLVFSGCLTGFKRGSAAARSISIGVGGSQVSTHVRIYTAGPNGTETNLREYDLVTKGTNYGGGLIVGLARAKRTSVEGDGKHAADQIVEKYFADTGAPGSQVSPAPSGT